MNRFMNRVLLLLLLTGCGSAPEIREFSLLEQQPFIIEVTPADGSVVSAPSSIKLRSSQPLDPRTVSLETVALAMLPEQSMSLEKMLVDISSGRLEPMNAWIALEEGGTVIRIRPEQRLQLGAEYGLFVGTKVRSSGGLPLNQNRGASPQPFLSRFAVLSSTSATGGSVPSEQAPISVDADDPFSGIGDEGGAEGGPADLPPPTPRPDKLVINEVLYDITGSDVDGRLFIELFGTAETDISNYRVLLINGDNGAITDVIAFPQGSLVGVDGLFVIADARTGSATATYVPTYDMIDNFDPQNGPDCIQLLDHQGRLLDALAYGNPVVALAQNGLACGEGSPAEDVRENHSLTRTNGRDTDDNASDFIANPLPTPGVL